MAQSLSKMYTHIVYSTKHREPYLTDLSAREHMHAYLVGICRNLECPSIRIGGVEDHVHILCILSRTMAVADLIHELKRSSSLWVKKQVKELKKFDWQDGYGAFSISPNHVDQLIKYIKNQEKHHKKESFQDEMRRLFKKYQIEYDEKYVWD